MKMMIMMKMTTKMRMMIMITPVHDAATADKDAAAADKVVQEEVSVA
jgi:hypothetical protein